MALLLAKSTRLPSPLLSLPSLSSSLPSLTRSPFSTSSTLLESKSRRKARLQRKAHLDSKALLTRSHALSAPDPVLGHARGNAQIWQNSLLKGVLLDRKDVWGNTVSVLPGEKSGSSTSSVGATAEGEGAETAEGALAQQKDRLFNFGLDSNEVEQLVEALPLIGAYQSTREGGMPASKLIQDKRFEKALEGEMVKRDALLRIIDLRNAASKGIEVENTRRIVEAFGREKGDTGSPEVQAAIMTSRIHSLATHLTSQPRDVHNRRPLRSLIQKRSKVLKYLRSLDVKRYETCLAKIGVERRAVEGEVVVTKKGLRSIIRGV
ncbi:small subunit ribosomal protein S15, partial [Phenoliferia sp. Uapishka_3]